MTGFYINGVKIDSSPKTIESFDITDSINVLENSVESFDFNKTFDENAISTEANEEISKSWFTKVKDWIIKLLDNIYRHIVSFIKAIINFFKNLINKITGKDQIKDANVSKDGQTIVVKGSFGVKTVSTKVDVKEIQNLMKGLECSYGMIKFISKQEYLKRIEELYSYAGDMCTTVENFVKNIENPNLSDRIAQLFVGTLALGEQQYGDTNLHFKIVTSKVEEAKASLFEKKYSEESFLKTMAMYGSNPTQLSKDISVQVMNKTKNMEQYAKRLGICRQKINAMSDYKSDFGRMTEAKFDPKSNFSTAINIFNKCFSLFQEIDNIILQSSSRISKICFEYYTLLSRAGMQNVDAAKGLLNGMAYMDRSISITQYGLDNYAISMKNVILHPNNIPENEFKQILEEARACNDIVNSNKTQAFDMNGNVSPENQHVINFMNFLQKYSRKIKSVVGTNKEAYVIYNFDIKIKQDKSGVEYIVVTGDLIPDTKKKTLEGIDKLYHTSTAGGLTALNPTSGNYKTGRRSVGGIKGIGINTSRVYFAKSPVTKQGHNFSKYIENMKNVLGKINSGAEHIDFSKGPKIAIPLIREIYKKYLSNLAGSYVYELDGADSKYKGHIFADAEHHGGYSGQMASKFTGGQKVNNNLVYIETDKPIPVKEITKEAFDKERNKSQFKALYEFLKKNKADDLLWPFE